MADLVLWKKPAKTGKILGIINLFFILMVVYNYSLLSLILLFVFFISIAGMALN